MGTTIKHILTYSETVMKTRLQLDKPMSSELKTPMR